MTGLLSGLGEWVGVGLLVAVVVGVPAAYQVVREERMGVSASEGGDRVRAAVEGRRLGALENVSVERLSRADETGMTPLMVAAAQGQGDVAEYLLGRGVDVNVADGQKGTALMMAAYRGSERILSDLLARGADLGVMSDTKADALTCAVVGGNLGCVERLLAAGANPNRSGRGYPVLQAAASAGDRADLVRVLVDAGAEVDARAGSDGATALMVMAQDGARECVVALLEAGADRALRNDRGETASDLAAREGFVEIAKMIDGWR